MVVLQACAFAAPAPGNFISSLLSLERSLADKGIKTIYAFPERARDKEWCKEIEKRTKVYFLPEAQARLRINTYKIFRTIYGENKVGIVHSHFELYDIPATVTAPKSARVFWHLHDALKENYDKSTFSRKILTKMQYGVFSRRAFLLSVSEEHALFAEQLGFKKENITYLPNGINTSRIDIEQIDLCKSKKKALMFGWEVYRKGVDVLVDAVKSMAYGIQVKVIGQDECERYLTDANVSEKIEFSKPVSDINILYKEALVFLHISRAEGLSYAFLEALYAGLPIICSDIPENLFSQEFRNILWVKCGDAEDLKTALETVSDGTWKVQQEDIDHNRELIEKKYSVTSWISRIESVYFG